MTVTGMEYLRTLGAEHPEWKPWLKVVEEVLREAHEPHWESFVPAISERQELTIPLLARRSFAVNEAAVRDWVRRLIGAAAESGAPNLRGLSRIADGKWNPISILTVSLTQENSGIESVATMLRMEVAVLKAVVPLFAVPLLHACKRAWTHAVNISWTQGYCPVCGAWPVFAEVRGIERDRFFRCGRCGSAWHGRSLLCPFCGISDHEQLGSLVPEKSELVGVVEICKRCLGYVKSFNLLQATSDDQVMLRDLASVTLDIAALNDGFKRPEGLGYAVNVEARPAPTFVERILPWRM